MCRIHKFYDVQRITTNPYVFKSFNNLPVKAEKNESFKQKAVEAEAAVNKTAVNADKIIREAREEAAKILKKANQDAARMLNQSSIEGYKKGLMAAESKVESTLLEIKQKSEKVIEDVMHKANSVIDALEENALDFSLDLAKKILDVELDRNDNAILSVVKQAISKLKNETEARVMLSAEDLAGLENMEELKTLGEQSGIHLHFVSDGSMGKGDVLIETDNGSIDAGVGTQFANIKSLLISS